MLILACLVDNRAKIVFSEKPNPNSSLQKTSTYSQLLLIQTSVIWNIHILAWFFWKRFSSSIVYLISPNIHILTMDISIWNNLYHLL